MGRVTPGQRRPELRLASVEDRARVTPRPLPPLPTTPVAMRSPCQRCAHPDGLVTRDGGQAVVRCAACHAYAYCAPRKEQLTWWGQTR